MVEVLCDIDGPLAWGNQQSLFQTYDDYFKLNLSKEQLKTVNSIDEFEALPEMVAFKSRVGPVKYNFLKQVVVLDPQLLRSANVISDAVEGVNLLATHGQAGYCTARRGMNERWTADVKKATRAWLQDKSFPHYKRVTFCEGPEGKLAFIASKLIASPQHIIVLIDDLYEKMICLFKTLADQEQEVLSQRFILGAYGSGPCATFDIPFKVIPLHSWKDADAFVCELKGCSLWHTKRKKMRERRNMSKK
ncbi:hypothetical protein [Dictyobacter arantiisoli]|uniref:Uncharacterized protein n=1 Tax=Dictyobacter arantiisoli TaxID=2014874 RepID=A0A5A5TGY5_9CHLR|nr:hypothetical protein [Dictyobacter arantiisoli]GCF10289.1 hypothetical protein KDI_38530 [Dictyobacter arantiisoli]